MNGAIRNSLKLPNSNLVGLLTRDTKNQLCASRLFSTLKKTNYKTSVVSASKLSVTSSTILKNYSSESNDVAVELNKFLEQEISSEKEMHGSKTIPSKIDDFEVKLDGAEVTLIKKNDRETIKISFNINDSVEADEGEFDESNQATNEPPELSSKPAFDIDIIRGDTTLGFSCNYVQEPFEQVSEDERDVFVIGDVTLYQGEYSDKVYTVSGEILDGYLYDLLMNLLDSKGITNEFVIKMSDLSTAYEQSSYISLLRALKDFTST